MYDVKYSSKNEIENFKTRIVAKRFIQKKVVDLFKIFFPVSKYDSLRLDISLSVHQIWERMSLDDKTVLLNASLEDEIFIL